jgi:hypothetical protein
LRWAILIKYVFPLIFRVCIFHFPQIWGFLKSYYTNYKSYNIKHNPHNTTNITTIYVDNQPCNNIPRTKDNDDSEGEKQPLLGKKEKQETKEEYFIEL